ncbi:MAG: hypothetical protein PUC73_05430 [Lachnospiraceae bacterium]|nr:hypothetical protein [Lachnospiraceae bacterium]
MKNGEYMTGMYTTCIPMIDSIVDDSAGTKQYCTCKFISMDIANNIVATTEYLDTKKDSGSQYSFYVYMSNKTGGKFKSGTKITFKGSISSDNSSPSQFLHSTTQVSLYEKDSVYGGMKQHVIFEKELGLISNKEFSFVTENDVDNLVFVFSIQPVFYDGVVLPGNINISLEDICIDGKLLKGDNISFPNNECFAMLDRIYTENNISKENYPYYIIMRNNEDKFRLTMLLASEKIHITRDTTYTQYPYAFADNSKYLFYRYRGSTIENLNNYSVIFSSFNEILFNNYDIMYNGEIVKPTNIL